MTFEYKVVGHCSEQELNHLGADGWELVAVEGNRSHFKRPKAAAAAEPMPALNEPLGVQLPQRRELFEGATDQARKAQGGGTVGRNKRSRDDAGL